MQTVKEIVHEIADQLPEQATLDDVMYTLYVRQVQAMEKLSKRNQDALLRTIDVFLSKT